MNFLEQIKLYLENNNFAEVKILNFNANLTNEKFNQIVIRELQQERQPKNYNQYKKIGFAVKNKDAKLCEQICRNVEYLFSNKRGGKLTNTAESISFNIITCKQSTTYIPSSLAQSENTFIYETQFEFIFQDTQLFKQF